MRRLGLIGGWVVVALLTTALTWWIVGAADAQVGRSPISELNVAAPVFDSTVPTTSTSDPTSPTSQPTTSVTASTATTVSGSSSSTDATPSTTIDAAWSIETISTAGGVVVVRYRPGEVMVQATTPAPGFRGEIEKGGPPEVEVEFESDSLKIEIHAKWEDGDLDVKVSESAED